MSIAKCPYFGRCGGCTSQNVAYPDQLERKKRLLASSARVPAESVRIFSGSEYGYRNRMDFVFHRTGLGLRERDKWWEVVDVGECAISEPKVNLLLSECRTHFRDVDFFDLREKKGTFRYAVIRTSGNSSSISFVLNRDSPGIEGATSIVREFARASSAENISVAYCGPDGDVSISGDFLVIKGSDLLEETYLGKRFQYSAQGFFQNNHAMAAAMQEHVHKLLGSYGTKKSHLLDLYGGVGTFGIINAPLFESVTTVEGAKECTDAALRNIGLNSASNVRAVCADASSLSQIPLPAGLFAVTDPPRSGMHPRAILGLLKLKPKVIIYISCNLHQLSREMHHFSGYEVKSAALFDLFPQTPHCEGVLELVRKS